METLKMKIYLEIEVDVVGKYHKGNEATYFQPAEYPEFEINKVLWHNVDITECLDSEKFDFDELETDCIAKINDIY